MSKSLQIDHQLAVAGQRHPQDQEELVYGLLNGFIENNDICYWDDRSPEENRGRAALAEILRSGRPLSQFFRNQLAALIAPQGNEVQVVKRRIKFEYTLAGSPAADYKISVIAEAIYEAVVKGKPLGTAVSDAAKKYHLSERRIWAIWRRLKALLETLRGPLPRSRAKPNRIARK